jgi:DNA primase
MKTNLYHFDPLAYLQSRRVRYFTEGKNTQGGWVSLNCPFCSDHSNHLGINLESKGISCFKCGESGKIFKLIMKLERCDFARALTIVSEFSRHTYLPPIGQERDIRALSREYGKTTKALRPESVRSELTKPVINYLRKRRYLPRKTFKKYKLGSFGPVGRYKYRLYIPIYLDGRLISFTTRDMTGKQKIPYLHLPRIRSAVFPKDTLYNIDNAREDTALVVEGPFDAWRFGDGAVATFGTIFTHSQVKLLSRFSRRFIMFDAEPEAQKLAEELAYTVAGDGKHTEIIKIPEGDPDNITTNAVNYIKRQLFGKIY